MLLKKNVGFLKPINQQKKQWNDFWDKNSLKTVEFLNRKWFKQLSKEVKTNYF